MFQNGWWAPSVNDYGSTGTRPPMNLNLPGQLQLQDNQTANQQKLAGQQQGFEGVQNALQRAMQEAMQGRNLGFQGQQAALDRTQASGLQSSALANQMNIARLPIDFAREKFDQVFPMVNNYLGSAFGAEGGGTGTPVGGAGGQAQLAPSTIYSPGQIQQQVNAMRSGNNQAAATQQRQNSMNTAAGGFGSNSPLLQALNQQSQMGALSANTAGERETRMGAAGANAKQGLAAASQNNQARIGFEQNQIEANRNQVNGRTSLLAALAGML